MRPITLIFKQKKINDGTGEKERGREKEKKSEEEAKEVTRKEKLVFQKSETI